MIDTDVTQQPRLTQPGYVYCASAESLADGLQELVDALRSLGDIDLCPTSVHVGLQVTQSQGKHRDRCATVDDLCRALGLPVELGPCGDWWSYGSPYQRSVRVFTDACSADEYEEARRAAGWRGCAAAAMVEGTSPCEGEPESVRVVVDETGTEVAGCPVHAGMLARELTGVQRAEFTSPDAVAKHARAAWQVAEEWLAISDSVMTTGLTGHWAHRDAFDPGDWWVTWIDGPQSCTRYQATVAMAIAIHVGVARANGETLDEQHEMWPVLSGWAIELGMSAARAVSLASAELPASADEAFINPAGQVQDLGTGRWLYVREGFARVRARQLAEQQAGER